MAPFASLAGRIADDGGELRARFFTELVHDLPHARGMFPEGATTVPPVLADALRTFLLAAPDSGAPVGPELTRRLRGAALDLRRFGFPSTAYETFAAALNRVLDAPEAAALITSAAGIMAREASAADHAGIPPATAARVTGVEDRGTDGRIKVVRLEAGMGLGYRPGQCVPVLQAGRQGVWVNLAPALPPNRFGQLEFHVDGEFDPVVDSYVTVGAARGPVVEARADERLLIVAVGTGAAVAKALVFDFLERGERPDVDVLLHAPTRRDHYDARSFAAVAEHHAWLRVHRAPLGTAVPGEVREGRNVIVCGPSATAGPVAAGLGGESAGIRLICPDEPPRWF